MSDKTPTEQMATIILTGSAVISVIIGFASVSIGTAFMGMALIFSFIGDSLLKLARSNKWKSLDEARHTTTENAQYHSKAPAFHAIKVKHQSQLSLIT